MRKPPPNPQKESSGGPHGSPARSVWGPSSFPGGTLSSDWAASHRRVAVQPAAAGRPPSWPPGPPASGSPGPRLWNVLRALRPSRSGVSLPPARPPPRLSQGASTHFPHPTSGAVPISMARGLTPGGRLKGFGEDGAPLARSFRRRAAANSSSM